MKILDINDLKSFNENTYITIGFFDGVHKGHQLILNTLKNKANENNFKSLIITFDEDVLDAFKMTKSLIPINEKMQIFEKLNIDYVLLLKRKDNFMNLTALEFIDKFLTVLNCKGIICGKDFNFGKDGKGNIDTLKKYSDYKIELVNDFYFEDNKVSSSYIRDLLANGKVEIANKLLFNPFHIEGEVIYGKQLGRTIGFKTANIHLDEHKFLLKNGVYFGTVDFDEKTYYAMINVGYNPTVEDNNKIKLEVHILDFSKDIYEKKINVCFLNFHREERKFDSVNLLKTQLEKDIICLKKLIKK